MPDPKRKKTHTIVGGGPDAGFLGCPDCGGDEWAVVCRGLPGRPHVAVLLCAECDPPREVYVRNGEISYAQ